MQPRLLRGARRTQQQWPKRRRAEVSQGRHVGDRPSLLPVQSGRDGPASSACARPRPGRAPKPRPQPARTLSSILAPLARSVLLSYKLLDGEAARPALVFLHGLFGSKTNFNSIAKALAQQTGRRVSFRERRGPAGGGAWLGGTRGRPRRGPLLCPSCRLPAQEYRHTVTLGGLHSFSQACICPVLHSCYRPPRVCSTLSLDVLIIRLSRPMPKRQ